MKLPLTAPIQCALAVLAAGSSLSVLALQKDLCLENGGAYVCTAPVFAKEWHMWTYDAPYAADYTTATNYCLNQASYADVTGATVDEVLQKYTTRLIGNGLASCYELWPDAQGAVLRQPLYRYYAVGSGSCAVASQFDTYNQSNFRTTAWDPSFRAPQSTCVVNFEEHNADGTVSRIAQSLSYPVKRVSCSVGSLIGDGVNEPAFCIEDGNGKPENLGQPDCGNVVGNPINAGTGNKFASQVDYADSRGLLTLTRYFNSQGGSHSFDFGGAWSHFYDSTIEIRTGTVKTLALLHRADGQVLIYEQAGGGNFTYKVQSGTYTPGGSYRLRATTSGSTVTGYRYVDLVSNTVESYDANGKLTGIAKGDTYQVTLSYDSVTGLLQTVTDSFGRTITFNRHADGTIASAYDPAGRIYLYEYGTGLSLTKVTFPDQKNRQYVYESQGQLGGVIDENGDRYATFKYNTSGTNLNERRRALSTEHAGGVSKFTIDYTNFPTQATVTDPLGTDSVRSFSIILDRSRLAVQGQAAGAGCAASTKSNGYDSYGRLTQSLDFNGTQTCYAYYSTYDNEQARVEGVPSTTSCGSVAFPAASLPSGTRKISTAWHPQWRLPTQVASPKLLITYVYNGRPDPTNGNAVVSCAPAGAVLPTGSPAAVLCKTVEQATTDSNGQSGLAATIDTGVAGRVWTYTYDTYGQVLTAKNPLNFTTTYSYYTDQTPDHMVGDLQTVTNALGHVVTSNKYNRDGQMLQKTDPTGLVTVIDYDERQRPLSISAGGQTTTYSYDNAGQLIGVTLPDGTAIGYSYDAAHRLIGATDAAGNTVTYTLDTAGNRTAETYRDANGVLANGVTRIFDALNRLQSVTGVAQ